MINVFDHLNDSDTLLELSGETDHAADSAHRRVLGRLGTYTAAIVGPLNLRPTAAALHAFDANRIEVRISTASSHVMLVIAPEGDLAAEVFFLRSLAAQNLPAPRLIAHDLSCQRVPFTYTLESYIGGVPLDRLEDGPLMRVAARQIGRALRRAHQIAAPGFGRPTASGRWLTRTWIDVLHGWLEECAFQERAPDLFGPAGTAALLAATLAHPAIDQDQPSVIHGAVAPPHALVTVGDTAQLEALVRPGAIVGGDPLFDLAQGLLPHHPAAFRQGLIEGYTASGTLTPEQEQRLQRLRLLLWAAATLSRGDVDQVPQIMDAIASIPESQVWGSQGRG